MHLLAGFISLAVLQIGPAESAKATELEKTRMKRWMEFYTRRASAYEIFLDGDDRRQLEFQPKIILKYTNPVRTHGQHGAFYVWTFDGRPEAVGTIWSIRDRTDPTKRITAHELQSLSLSPLTSKRPPMIGRKGIVPQWSPQNPGIQLQKFRNAAAPANSAAGRLFQMRRLAREFDAVSIASDDESERTLRLVPQPLYRYKSVSAKVVDGGLFCFVMGTDPELLLLIECRLVNGKPQWHFAAARFTGIPLKLRRNGQVVWECQKAEPYVGGHPYFLYVGVAQFDADLAGSSERPD